MSAVQTWKLATIGAILTFALVGGLEVMLPSETRGHPVHHHGAAKEVQQRQVAFQQEMNRDMAMMMQRMHAPGYSGNADVDFLAMMIPHHQGAVDMARAVLTHGNDPLTRQLAEEIIAAQQAEIAAMTARMAILRRGPDPAPDGFPSLSGTRGR